MKRWFYNLGFNLKASKEGWLSALWRWISLSSKKRNCNVSNISNVSIFLCLVFFIRKAGRYTSSSLLSECFRWREKQFRTGLSGHISKLATDLCCLNNSIVLFRRIKTNIYGNSSKSVLCFGRRQYHLCLAVQLGWNVWQSFLSVHQWLFLHLHCDQTWHKPRRNGSEEFF